MHEGLMFILTYPAPNPEPGVREFVYWMIGLGKVGAGAVLIALCSRYRYPIYDFNLRDLDTTREPFYLIPFTQLVTHSQSTFRC